MPPSAPPKTNSDSACCRFKDQRQGRQTHTRISAAKPTRRADVPCAPIKGNSCLASEVPTPRDVTDPNTASTGHQ